MKKILSIAIALMIGAGIYGATDMVIDLRSKNLIEYENVRDRHARNLLMIIKTCGLPHSRREVSIANPKKRDASSTDRSLSRKKPDEIIGSSGHTSVEVMEIFSRGDIEFTLESITTEEDKTRAFDEASRDKSFSGIDDVAVQNSAEVIPRR